MDIVRGGGGIPNSNLCSPLMRKLVITCVGNCSSVIPIYLLLGTGITNLSSKKNTRQAAEEMTLNKKGIFVSTYSYIIYNYTYIIYLFLTM